ncbi:uncharacterized protein L203_102021 [Cryptococcus depauperatus CBS 7841]|uniref:Uncharacterized protein n=1 Tax=Cryptococcus depauperatus CBS 7841 TaxID=1295531 RepID=A0A1E3IR63_9TREE|nr:hypothetical protein L203_01274 [Cryptococcus depauperatus CBS 7841]
MPQTTHSSLPPIGTKLPRPLKEEDQPGTAPIPSLRSPEPPTPVTAKDPIAIEANTIPSPSSLTPLTPSLRSPLSRPLSPDLPNRDALYLFSNFSSYMRSPHEGSDSVSPEDFKDTIRLLEHARLLASQPNANVSILHLKYRFQGQHNSFRSPYSSGDHKLPLNFRDSIGRVRNPVPQPFSALHDPVVKIDYMENGIFDPLPAQAVFGHIAKMCQPPPRIIVVSYVYSKVTENHLSSLSTWALTSSPPAYIFSPLETRLREQRTLHLALNHAIPISMYAWPAETVSSPNSLAQFSPGFSFMPNSPNGPLASPTRSGYGKLRRWERELSRKMSADSPILLTRRISGQDPPYSENRPNDVKFVGKGSKGNRYPPDPIASLTIITSSDIDLDIKEKDQKEDGPNSAPLPRPARPGSAGSGPPPVDRIPLWHLAPGVGVLHGSTSASIGVRLGDFSAINLVGESGLVESGEASKEIKESEVEDLGVKTEKMGVEELRKTDGMGAGSGIGAERNHNIKAAALLERPISRPSSAAPVSVGIPEVVKDNSTRPKKDGPYSAAYLTPPEKVSGSLGRPWHSLSSQSWPAPVSRVPGWRKGRKEIMEDTLEELGIRYTEGGFELDEVLRKVEELNLVQENPMEERPGDKQGPEGDEGSLLDLLVYT